MHFNYFTIIVMLFFFLNGESVQDVCIQRTVGCLIFCPDVAVYLNGSHENMDIFSLVFDHMLVVL